MKKLLIVLIVTILGITFSGCSKNEEEVAEPMDVTEYVTAYHNEDGMGWDWSEVYDIDFDGYNWFQDIFKKDTEFRTDIFVDGKEHYIEFTDTKTDEIIAFAEFDFA
jgi:uncharacterized protein YceK